MKIYDKINQERKDIINKTKHTISDVPRAQKEVAELLPDLFEKKRFFSSGSGLWAGRTGPR